MADAVTITNMGTIEIIAPEPENLVIETVQIQGIPGISGVTDHGALTGLSDDDHTQYALADGSRGAFAAPLGADDNYVTNAEKTKLVNLRSTCVYMAGQSWNTGITCPDTNALDITGDIDLRIKVGIENWNASQGFGLMAKAGTSQDSWKFIYGWGGMAFNNSTTGSGFQTYSIGTANVPWKNDVWGVGWLRVTLDVDNGSGGSTATFYCSTDGVTWTQLSQPLTIAGITSIFASTSPVILGTDYASTFTGKIYAAEIRNGIDGPIVASWKSLGSLDKYRDPQGNVWTVTAGTAAVMEG